MTHYRYQKSTFRGVRRTFRKINPRGDSGKFIAERKWNVNVSRMKERYRKLLKTKEFPSVAHCRNCLAIEKSKIDLLRRSYNILEYLPANERTRRYSKLP